jgi:hypothetical protein
MASWFKHIAGVLVLGVELPDGSTATVPAASTDVFGTVVVQEHGLVLDADGLRGLRALATRLLESAQDRPAGRTGDRGGRARGGAGMPGSGLGLSGGAGGF